MHYVFEVIDRRAPMAPSTRIQLGRMEMAEDASAMLETLGYHCSLIRKHVHPIERSIGENARACNLMVMIAGKIKGLPNRIFS